MNNENADILNSEAVVENLTRTLLYEGYSLFPYNRSAIKNQKPIPFGVVFPKDYNLYNEHAHSTMQTQCIVTGSDNLLINISIRFLHLIKIELFENVSREKGEPKFIPVYNLNVNDKSYQSGWQTIERKISTGGLHISQLIKNKKIISIEFEKIYESKFVNDESKNVAAKQINNVSAIKGQITIEAAPIENMQNAFQITLNITNTTPVENAELVTRDDVLLQSFLSTHTILQTKNAKFISHQNPGEQEKEAISKCENKNTWPILIDENDTTLLSSPIILYDYPQINPQSHGDLFDSTEIEEALLLHVNLLSDEEKKRIGESDEKLQAMLQKVSEVTPEELINFHSGLRNTAESQITNANNSEL